MSVIFGPVPSRRLGRSLGIDLIPFKTCPYNCIYCQLGPTTHLSLTREVFTPVGTVLDALEETLRKGCMPDYITLSGSGEPTLYAELGPLIAGIKARTDTPVAILTNGALLWDAAVRHDIHQADLIIPSLDAGTATLFRCINRPHPDVSFTRMLEGLVALRTDFSRQIWLEVMLLAGMTAIKAEVEKLRAHIARIRPDRIQVNTVVRPPAAEFALPVAPERLARFAEQLGPQAEVICDYTGIHESPTALLTRQDIIDLLRRRPCSLDDIAQGLTMHPNEVIKHLEYLTAHQCLQISYRLGKRYYTTRHTSAN